MKIVKLCSNLKLSEVSDTERLHASAHHSYHLADLAVAHHRYSSTPLVPLQSREPPPSESRHTPIIFFVNQSTKSQKPKQRKPIRKIIFARLHHHHPCRSKSHRHQRHEPQSAQSKQPSRTTQIANLYDHCDTDRVRPILPRDTMDTVARTFRPCPSITASAPRHLCLLHYRITSSVFLSIRSQDSISSTLQLQALKLSLPTITGLAKPN
ncbi:hypothetical protein VIGAN_05195600 [Vigna angularis var. angularis]|uniref:Uncharacterized protein n=1 Tax=Vigna angularis var. angularis TaxID=157739 RepID=A0A0S3S6H8_PHAAN|nr:hypothetical protein VIGAN_05195600 [Vigna angularis var. angularis]